MTVAYACPMDLLTAIEEQMENNMLDQGYKYGMILEDKKPNNVGWATKEQALEALVDSLKEEEVSLSKVVKNLALIFGSGATLDNISGALQDMSLPTKIISGKTYVAGYRGTNIINNTEHPATLVDIVETKETNTYKLLFVVGNRYVYSIPTELHLIDYIKNVNIKDFYTIDVEHETIKKTGDFHAVVINWYPRGK
jgi:hypothetical protein